MKDKLTWEGTIQYIRKKPEYKELVELAYFEEDLSLNVERFRKSEEFIETLHLLRQHIKLVPTVRLLDVGSGNGISAVSFALEGIQVDAVEPDPSETIGAGAIRKLKQEYKLNNLQVYEGFAEELKFDTNTYDIIYVRQCMHHAYHLKDFLKECARVLKPNGLLLTIRDHVVFNAEDKMEFLASHPLHKYYGGENAFTEEEYRDAIISAGFKISTMFRHFDSVINYFPLSRAEKEAAENKNEDFALSVVNRKLGVLSKIGLLKKIALKYVHSNLGKAHDEKLIPWRMYTFLAVKK